MRSNVALIGFMGVGKTAVGRVLAEKLDMEFLELDWLIERKAGKPIPQIFKQDGEIMFRQLEIDITREIAGKEGTVIACGGGMVLNKINIDRLSQTSRVIYLTVPSEVILERTANDPGQRPLLEVDNPSAVIAELMEFREPLYRSAADIALDTSELSIEAVAEQIIDRLKKDESFNK
jgi:shikimate kinase